MTHWSITKHSAETIPLLTQQHRATPFVSRKVHNINTNMHNLAEVSKWMPSRKILEDLGGILEISRRRGGENGETRIKPTRHVLPGIRLFEFGLALSWLATPK
jgi:hypothetical protein